MGDFEWKDIGKKIIGMGAPVLGAALLGPAGGAAAGALVAKLFGADATPSAIDAAIQADPNAIIKLKELEYKHEERFAEIALDHARLENEKELGVVLEVNKTMREESKSEHWPQWAWRPYWGFVSGTAFLVVCIFIGILAYKSISSDVAVASNTIGSIPIIIGAYASLFSIAGAILGITAWGRNKLKEKVAGAGKINV